MNDRGIASRLVDAASSLVALLVIGWLVWASGKGLDLSDEGFYLLTARHPEDVLMLATSFHHLTAWLLWATGGSIVAIRIVAVLGTAAAGAVLGDTVLRISGMRRSALPLCVVTMGALLAYAWFLLTPSYNTYNGWAVAGATVCALRAFMLTSQMPVVRRRWCAWMFGVGLWLGLSLFVKFPTAAAMGLLVGIAIAGWPRLTRRDRATAVLSVAMGMAATAALMFLVIVSPRDWWRETIGGLDHVTRLGAGHGLSAVGRYARELRGHLGEGTRPVVWLLWAIGFTSAAVLAAARDSRTRRGARAAIWAVVAAAAVRSTFETIAWLFPPILPSSAIRDPFPFWTARFHLHWLVLMVAIAVGGDLGARLRGIAPPHRGEDRQRVLVGLLLAGGTVAAAFGTANPIYINLMLAAGSWFALLVFAAHHAATRLEWSGAGHAVMVAVLSFAAVQIVAGSATLPYGLNDVMLRQTIATSIGSPPARLSLDPETHETIVDLRRIADGCGFHNGDDVLAFHTVPGLVYAIGGRSPGVPWFTSGLAGSRAANEMGLAAAGAVRVSRAFILETPDAEPWLRSLAPLGVEFPARYTYCGTVTRHLRGTVSEWKLWRPASLPAR